MGIAAAVFSGFALAVLAPQLHRGTRDRTGWILAVLPAAIFGYFATFLNALPIEGVSVAYRWAPSLGLHLSFRLDGLSLLFALLISGMGAIVLVYAGGYMGRHPQLGRLYAFLLLFMGSMLGVVLADNVLTLFVFWELTSISSYLLIGFDHRREQARAAALQALLITGGGGLALMAGLLLLGQAGRDFGLLENRYELSALLTLGTALHGHALYLPILVLVLLGAFTKSAQFPFHFWLPGAMEAPTPVSAYLHSATMVKAGIYLLARLSPVLGGTQEWLWSVAGLGAITMLSGAVLAMSKTDLKQILAYSTVSALGLLTLLLGLHAEGAVAAAVAFLLAHALYKGALFLVAGAVDHEAGTRDVEQLGGLWRVMPITAAVACLAALAMAGLPPLFGFIGKELFYEATLHAPAMAWVTAAGLASSMFFVAIAGLVGIEPFLGRQLRSAKAQPHEAPLSMWLGPALLAGTGLVLGLAPWLADAPLLAPAVGAVRGLAEPVPLKLALWHGWNLALQLSMVTVVGGLVLFALRRQVRRGLNSGSMLMGWGPARWYQASLAGLNGLARAQTDLLQTGYLRHYLLATLMAAVALTGFTMLTRTRLTGLGTWYDLRFYEVGLGLLILMSLLAAIASRTRLAAIAALGVVGYSVALIFVLFGAPDVAMTQFLVETLTVILFVLVFYHLPASEGLSTMPMRVRDAAVAIAVGVLMSTLVLIAVQVEFADKVSDYYLRESVKQAHGRNIVNVILVDFRGLDTLGEITVLAAAAIGVYALLKLRPRRKEAA